MGVYITSYFSQSMEGRIIFLQICNEELIVFQTGTSKRSNTEGITNKKKVF